MTVCYYEEDPDDSEEEEEYYEMEEFKIENEVTGEILELECKEYNNYFLFRHQKGTEKVEEFERKANSTSITFEDYLMNED